MRSEVGTFGLTLSSSFFCRYYKAILTKRLSFLRSVSKSSLLNVAMELRKCANHPYLCMPSIPESIPGPEQAERYNKYTCRCPCVIFAQSYLVHTTLQVETNIVTRLIAASSKLSFLHGMLPKLKARGHRVLIFSQFTMLLDVLEDYVKSQEYPYSRIDGMVRPFCSSFSSYPYCFFFYYCTLKSMHITYPNLGSRCGASANHR